jgi:hypothetical protein
MTIGDGGIFRSAAAETANKIAAIRKNKMRRMASVEGDGGRHYSWSYQAVCQACCAASALISRSSSQSFMTARTNRSTRLVRCASARARHQQPQQKTGRLASQSVNA